MVKEGSFFGDHGGYLTALKWAIESAKLQCGTYAVSAESSLLITVSLSVVDIPVVLGERPAYGIRYGDYYQCAESDDSAWFVFSRSKMDAYVQASTVEARTEAWADLEPLRPVEIYKAPQVWASNHQTATDSEEILATCLDTDRIAVQQMLVELHGA